MKRFLDNNCIIPSQRRISACNLKGENSVRTEMALGRDDLGIHASTGAGGVFSAPRLTVEDAMQYLKAVKECFRSNNETYNEFVKVMMDFKERRIDSSEVISKVKQLFRGHTELLMGFNMFLPDGEEISSPIADEQVPPKTQILFDEAMNYVNKIKGRFQNDDTVYKVFLDILNKYRLRTKSIDDVYREVAALFQDHGDMVEEFSRFLPYCPTSDSPNTTSPKSSTMRDRTSDSSSDRQIEGTPQNDRDFTNAENDDISNGEDRCKRKRSERGRVIEEKDSDHEKHTSKKQRGGDDFGDGDVGNFASHHASGQNASDGVNSHSFFELVKMKLRTPEIYQEYMRCIHLYTKGTLARPELLSLVNDLFQKDSFLMDSFITFLDQCDRKECSLDVLLGKRFACDGESMSKFTEDKGKEVEAQKLFVPNKEKYQSKSIGDIDFTNTERCSPSYRLLPHDYPIPVASCRTTPDSIVLNDHWVSVTSGSEDYSFKHMRKNQFEEALFRCEDDRFELDMLLESVDDTTRRAEELMEFLNKRKIEYGDSFPLGDYLKAFNLRCIERLYGDHGLDVIDVLKRNLPAALPVVLTRLKQKQDEWIRCRSEFNVVWADIYAKNHQKSLDQRCSYFKLQDAKNMNAKALLAEIKEISEQKKNQDDGVLAFCTPGKQCMSPHLVFDFPDQEVHEDIYQIMKYNCHETGTSEQFDKSTKIWTYFLEPMLGLPPRGSTSDSDSSEVKVTPAPNDREEGELSPMDVTKDGYVDVSQQKSKKSCADDTRNQPIKSKPVIKRDYARCAENVRLFYGTESFYLVVRLYQIAYERILSAKSLSRSKDNYRRFLTALFKLIDGSSDNAKFEDDCRAVIGPNSYLVFTLDKLVHKLQKLMQTMATDEVETKFLELNAYEKSRSSFVDSLYHENARAIFLPDTLFRIESVCSSNSSTSTPTRVSVRLMDEKPEFSVPSVSTDGNYADYVQKEFVVPCEERGTRGLFLKRNLRKCTGMEDGCVPEGIIISNSLECRLSFRRSKVLYASNTEDFLFNVNRKRQKRSP